MDGWGNQILTAGTKRIAVHLLARVLDRNLFRQQDHRAFTGAICGRPGLQAHEAEHASGVDDPAAVAGGVRGLGEELLDGVFTAEEDGAGVDSPGVKGGVLSWGDVMEGGRWYGKERLRNPWEGIYMVKSHTSCDISCTFPADSVPPVPALLHILDDAQKSVMSTLEA